MLWNHNATAILPAYGRVFVTRTDGIYILNREDKILRLPPYTEGRRRLAQDPAGGLIQVYDQTFRLITPDLEPVLELDTPFMRRTFRSGIYGTVLDSRNIYLSNGVGILRFSRQTGEFLGDILAEARKAESSSGGERHTRHRILIETPSGLCTIRGVSELSASGAGFIALWDRDGQLVRTIDLPGRIGSRMFAKGRKAIYCAKRETRGSDVYTSILKIDLWNDPGRTERLIPANPAMDGYAREELYPFAVNARYLYCVNLEPEPSPFLLVFDRYRGTLVREVNWPWPNTRLVKFSGAADNTYLYTSQNNIIRVWDATTLQPILDMTGSPDPVGAFAWDGRRFYTVTRREGEVFFWSRESRGTLRVTFPPREDEPGRDRYQPPAIAESGDVVFVVRPQIPEQRRIEIFNKGTGNLIGAIPFRFKGPVVLAAGADFLYAAAQGPEIMVWKKENREGLPALQGHTAPVITLLDIGDGILVSGSVDGTMRVWDVQAGRCLNIFECGQVSVLKVFREFLYSGTRDGTITVWDRISWRPKRVLRQPGSLICLTVVLDEIYSGTRDNIVRRYSGDGSGSYSLALGALKETYGDLLDLFPQQGRAFLATSFGVFPLPEMGWKRTNVEFTRPHASGGPRV